MAGHNLLFYVGSWEAVLVVGDDPADAVIEVSADGGSLRVQEGSGGVQSLSDDQKTEIEQTVDNEVLKGERISFESKSVRADGDGLRVEGDLTLHGTTLDDSAKVMASSRACIMVTPPTRPCNARRALDGLRGRLERRGRFGTGSLQVGGTVWYALAWLCGAPSGAVMFAPAPPCGS